MGTDVGTAEIWDLVGAWRTLPDIADELGVEVTKVRQLVRDGNLIAARREAGSPLCVPAAFLEDGTAVKGLTGTITVLRDAGYDDVAALRWLFTADPSLPGAPIEALRENRGTEVRRRAQALAL